MRFGVVSVNAVMLRYLKALKMDLKIKSLHPNAKAPTYATEGAFCFDFFVASVEDGLLYPGESIIVGTGLSFEIPRGFGMLIFSRSGHGFRDDIRLANCVGVIDSDYRGEVKVKLTRDGLDGDKPIRINVGDRVAQGVIMPLYAVTKFTMVDELGSTERGSNGFGSTDRLQVDRDKDAAP